MRKKGMIDNSEYNRFISESNTQDLQYSRKSSLKHTQYNFHISHLKSLNWEFVSAVMIPKVLLNFWMVKIILNTFTASNSWQIGNACQTRCNQSSQNGFYRFGRPEKFLNALIDQNYSQMHTQKFPFILMNELP